MNALAREIGVAPKTLSDDTRIYETFGGAMNGGVNLDREHYRVALSAPDPKAAIELARGNREGNSSYTTRDFRELVRKLQAIETPDANGRERSQSVRLGPEALETLDQLRKRPEFIDLDKSAIVTHALVDLLVRTVANHQSNVTEDRTRRSDRSLHS